MIEETVREAGDHVEPSGLDESELLEKLKDWFQADDEHSSDWRDRARENFDFYAGKQWKSDDVAKLQEQSRPVITFNRCIAIVKSVCGLEINSRHDTVFLPREGNDQEEVRTNEILTAGSRWMADGCDAEDEQSEAFQDTVITGMGWTEATVDFERDPDGMYAEAKINPLEMRWDKNARAKNLSDSKRMWRVREMPIKDAMDMFPDVAPEDLDAGAWAGNNEPGPGGANARAQKRRREEDAARFDPKGMVTIVHAQWIEREQYHRVAHPVIDMAGGVPRIGGYKELELTPQEFAIYGQEAEAQGLEFKAVQQTRQVYKQAYIGGKILSGVMPGPSGNAFSWNCITGERDANAGTWFGLIDIMRDPQMYANKWLSQTLHILNTTAKGGILAEEDAFTDMREAQKTYARPDAVTFLTKGAIGKGKIMAKPGTGIAGPYVQLMEFAISAIRDVPGVNLELLGMRDANQPGILEHQRKQAGLTILATLFDSLRRFRKRVGRVRLHYLQEYFADGRLIRVAGPDGKKFMRLIKDRMLGKYDVEVDDAPTSPNQREQNWFIIQQLFPVFRDLLTPESVVVLLEFSPLPAQVVEAFKRMLATPKPEEQQQHQLAVRGEVAKIAQAEAQTEKERAAAMRERAAAILDMASAYSKGAEARLKDSQAAKTDREATIDELLAKIKELAGEDAVEPQPSGLPLPPDVPNAPPAQPNVALSGLIDPASFPALGDEYGAGNPINR